MTVKCGLDEEVVEGESRHHGGEQRRPDAADERHEHDEQLVREHVAVIDSSLRIENSSQVRSGPPTSASGEAEHARA